MKTRLLPLALVFMLLLSACASGGSSAASSGSSASAPSASAEDAPGKVVTVSIFDIRLPDDSWRADTLSLGSVGLFKDGHYLGKDPTIKLFMDDKALEDSRAFAGSMFPPLPDSEFELAVGPYTCVGDRAELAGKESTAIVDRVFYPVSDNQTLRFQVFAKNGDVDGLEKDDPEVLSIIQSVIELNGYDAAGTPLSEKAGEDGVVDSGTDGATTWTLYSDGTLHIGGSADMVSHMNSTDYAWAKYRDDVTAIQFDTDVTRISELAFKQFRALKKVELPSSVKKLYIGCFESCSSLEEVVLPEGLEEVEYYVFCDCASLKEITIPGTLKHVNNYAFDSCTGLETARICSGVESFGYDVFSACTSLKTVYLPKSLKLIDLYSFYNTGLQDVYYEGSEADFAAITIEDCNDDLRSAVIHYDSAG